ncbi:MAG: oligosaccharide flippase family protein [Gammaproteobacteria bacterium]|nr:oligosaccharide flippase family protein [Gammaproteobacteria bacterium]
MKTPGAKSIFVNALYSSGARGLSVVARAVYVVIVAKHLGPESYGLYSYALAWYLLFVPISALGMDSVLVREIGRGRFGSEAVFAASLSLRGVTSLLVAILCFSTAVVFEESAEVRSLLLVLSVALLGRSLALWATAVFRGSESSQYILSQEATYRLLEVVLGVLLVINGFGVIALAIVHASCWVLQGLSSMYLVRRRLGRPLRVSFHYPTARKLLSDGMPFVISALVGAWLVQGALVLLRHGGGDPAGLGQFALALQVFVLLGSVVAELAFAAIPVLSRSEDRQDGKTQHFLDATFRIAWFMSTALTVGAVALGRPVVSALFGESYLPSVPLIVWASALVGIFFLGNGLRSMLVARGGYYRIVWANVAGAAAFTALYFPLSEVMALHGVFLALCVGYLLVAGVQVVAVGKYLSLNWGWLVGRPLLAATLTMGACMPLSVANPFVGLVGGIAVLILSWFLLGLVPLEKIRATLG